MCLHIDGSSTLKRGARVSTVAKVTPQLPQQNVSSLAAQDRSYKGRGAVERSRESHSSAECDWRTQVASETDV